ncbi:ion transporter [Methanogenium organophilum]|uniref:Ion transporter n=1 Tax=Methanogenium organophilum TaxID=2199 RepID=A0A9X9S5Q6_METOG|nr:ion transporter [Methanogenium organophilum]WAI02001.1 ion transporter [Methanogenium organophilum]
MIHIKRREQLDLGYEIFIAAVSILSVFNMVLSNIPGVDQDAVNVVFIINAVLTLLFISDFGIRLGTAPSRSYYFLRDYGWADLLAVIPMFRIFRLFRIYKAYRIVHKYGSGYIRMYLSRNRAESAVYIVVLMVLLIIESGAFLVLQAEQGSPSANIITASDAIWWAYVSITTVGYGDRYPVTPVGRLVGILVLTTGVAVFATFAGLISSKLLTPPEIEESSPEQPLGGDDQVARNIAELRQLIRDREKIETEIMSRIEELEQLLEKDNCPADEKK